MILYCCCFEVLLSLLSFNVAQIVLIYRFLFKPVIKADTVLGQKLATS